jgi:hypothetical protein
MSLTLADVPGILTEAELRTLIDTEAAGLSRDATRHFGTKSTQNQMLASLARIKMFVEALPDSDQPKAEA